MADTRVLLLASQQAVMYPWRGHRLLEPMSFGNDDAGQRAFAAYLEGDPSTPLRILVDVVEEEFREETIPHVFFGDRAAVLRTRTARLFRDARYTHAVLQGRETEGRRDDRVLFSAITRADLLNPWLNQIARHRVPLAGIHSLPLASQQLLRHIPVNTPYSLLVSVQSTGGLRQSFFVEQQLKISRLAVMPRLTLGQYAAYILAEVERVRRYLNSLRLLTRDSPLEVYLLAQGDVMDDLKQQVGETRGVVFKFVDLTALSSKLGARPPQQTPYADAAFARLLARQRIEDHYGRSEETRYYRLHQARSAMVAASMVALVGGMAWSGYRFAEAAIAEEQARNLGRQAAFYSERLERARAQLPAAPAGAREIQLTVRLAETLESYRTSPLPMMALVSRALGSNPGIQLDGLQWVVSTDPQASVESAGRDIGRDRAEPPLDVPPGTRFSIAAVRGHVEPFDGDYRLALDAVNNFADSLRELPGTREVVAVAMPLDLSSERRLQGSLENDAREAAFELRAVVELPPPAPPTE